MLLNILAIIVALVLFYLALINFYPSFSGNITKERQTFYESSLQFSNGKFLNSKKKIPEKASFQNYSQLVENFSLKRLKMEDPIERVSKKAQEQHLPLVTPIIGEPILIDELPKPNTAWWKTK